MVRIRGRKGAVDVDRDDIAPGRSEQANLAQHRLGVEYRRSGDQDQFLRSAKRKLAGVFPILALGVVRRIQKAAVSQLRETVLQVERIAATNLVLVAPCVGDKEVVSEEDVEETTVNPARPPSRIL